MSHITFTTPMPKDMKKQLDIANFITKRLTAGGLTPFETEVMTRYAQTSRQYAMNKFMFDGLKKPYAEKLKYCHHIDADIDKKLIYIVRDSTPEPNIFEKFATNFTISNNPQQNGQINSQS